MAGLPSGSKSRLSCATHYVTAHGVHPASLSYKAAITSSFRQGISSGEVKTEEVSRGVLLPSDYSSVPGPDTEAHIVSNIKEQRVY